ncbi:hypothetical protein D7N80_22575 [Salmonella enterica subsp. enterica]|uniref:Uncharacterized protein n=1 Tax=Salmonella enterica I TaxID=59201 RepID=A0A403QMP7_SALET|nr:hypothetical protein [Salmonella enterica subsp. enterica serovar Kidderminster]
MLLALAVAACSGCVAFCSLSGFFGGFWYIKDGLRLMLSIGLFCSCIPPICWLVMVNGHHAFYLLLCCFVPG